MALIQLLTDGRSNFAWKTLIETTPLALQIEKLRIVFLLKYSTQKDLKENSWPVHLKYITSEGVFSCL